MLRNALRNYKITSDFADLTVRRNLSLCNYSFLRKRPAKTLASTFIKNIRNKIIEK